MTRLELLDPRLPRRVDVARHGHVARRARRVALLLQRLRELGRLGVERLERRALELPFLVQPGDLPRNAIVTGHGIITRGQR